MRVRREERGKKKHTHTHRNKVAKFNLVSETQYPLNYVLLIFEIPTKIFTQKKKTTTLDEHRLLSTCCYFFLVNRQQQKQQINIILLHDFHRTVFESFYFVLLFIFSCRCISAHGLLSIRSIDRFIKVYDFFNSLYCISI